MIVELIKNVPVNFESVVIDNDIHVSGHASVSRGAMQSVRGDFYRYLVLKYKKELKQMNLEQTHIDQMWLGKRPIYNRDKETYFDITVEHIVDISRGGVKGFRNSKAGSNLCLIPDYLNEIFNYISLSQQMYAPDIEKHVAIHPTKVKGKYNVLPIVKGGFREEIKNSKVQEKRTTELFGFPFTFSPKG